MRNFDEQRLLDSGFQKFVSTSRNEFDPEVVEFVHYNKFITKKGKTLEVIVYNDTVMFPHFPLNISTHEELDTFLKLIGE